MPSLIRRVAGAGVAVFAAASLTTSTPAMAAADPFTVVNAASQLGGALPRGALLTIFTSRVSDEPARVYNPWRQTAPDGLYVEASCGSIDELRRLPLLYVGPSGGGTKINIYYPNSNGPLPWGPCADAGESRIRLHPAPGHGATMEMRFTTLRGHPGIFSIGDAPNGYHIDGSSGATTGIPTCNDRLPADPKACPVRTDGRPAALRLYLTGTDVYRCAPCDGSPLVFQLAPVRGDGTVGDYTAVVLNRLDRHSTGIERAIVTVDGNTPAGEYRLRVKTTERSETAASLRVEFGQPIGG